MGMPNLCRYNPLVFNRAFLPTAGPVETVDDNSETFRRPARVDLRISGAKDSGALDVFNSENRLLDLDSVVFTG
jgi:hypothetical protein